MLTEIPCFPNSGQILLQKPNTPTKARSQDIAIRLSKAFGSTLETWLKMQLAYDLAAAMQHERRIKVSRYHRAESVA